MRRNKGAATPVDRFGMKVLLVDADVDALDVTAQALRREGLSVITATDGGQALHRWQAERPDVLVLEADLPQLSGFEVCRQIRESGSTPVVLLSALATDEYVVRGFRLGGVIFHQQDERHSRLPLGGVERR